MTEVEFIPLSQIKVKDSRFRKTFTDEAMSDLQMSIQTGLGLINPITVDSEMFLNTGERRLRSFKVLNDLEVALKFNGKPIPPGTIPAIVVTSEADTIDLLKAELAENKDRDGFTFLEQAQAITKIAMLEQQIINKEREPDKPVAPITDLAQISPAAIKATAQAVYDASGGYYSQTVKDGLTITNAMEKNPDLARKIASAGSMNEAKKVIRSYEQQEQHAVLAQSIGKTFSTSVHTVIHGDCLEEMPKLQLASFDVCVTDPIYGINAHKFGDGAGRYVGISHKYDDSPETFETVMSQAIRLMSRLMKPDAHVYLACDIRNYFKLRQYLEEASDPANPWKIPNQPIIQYKVSGGKVPHPGFTYRNSWELWLYAYRGKKQLNHLINNTVECVSDRTETHGAAKPIDLLRTFLRNSSAPGEKCLDFMAGSGGILVACHEFKVRCTAIELNKSSYGRCLDRLKGLEK